MSYNALMPASPRANVLASPMPLPARHPGIIAYHGSAHDFDRFDSSKLHPDEAGHFFTQDEKLASDYADPHMYQVHIDADPAAFLDYGKLHPAEQAALNDAGAIRRLKAAGVPGITYPDYRGGAPSHIVFDGSRIRILRKYEFHPRGRSK